MHDVRYAFRVLRGSPGFAAIAILSLAVGIGANVAMFSVSWVLFTQPLAVRQPEDLFAVTNLLTIPRGMRGMYQINGSSYRDPVTGRNHRANVAYPAYLALHEAAGDAADVFAYSFVREANLALDGWATTGAAALVSGNYFGAAGVAMAMGHPLAVVTAIGVAVGVPMAIAGGKAVSSLLYGVGPGDPASLTVATVVISLVPGLAAYLPARRAAGLPAARRAPRRGGSTRRPPKGGPREPGTSFAGRPIWPTWSSQP